MEEVTNSSRWKQRKRGLRLRIDLPSEGDLLRAMRFFVWLISGLLVVSGCAGKKSPARGGFATGLPTNQKVIVTPDDSLVGKVAMVNQGFRFVVLNFPVGHLPAPEQHLNLYRRGIKVGEVKVTHQQYDDNVVADLSTGDAEVGDEARKQ